MNGRIPRLGDALIAVGLLAVSVVMALWGPDLGLATYREWDVWGWVLLAVQTLPLAWRQRNPRAVAWVTFLAWSALAGANYAATYSIFAVFIALYGLAAYLPRRTALIHGGSILGLMLLWTGIGMVVIDGVQWTSLVLIIFGVVLPMSIGFVDHRRTQRLTELERVEVQREQAEHEASLRAVAAERARIARELHDVVAHEMTVMTLQAEGARRMDIDPRLKETLGTIAESGRKGLAEMQRTIGVLRASEGVTSGALDLTPMPSLAGIPALARQVQDSGMPVRLSIVGDAHVPAGVELSAYRVVQESLTNALKYAGPGATAVVQVKRSRTAVTITVTDDGRGAAAEAGDGGGHGLLGMRERVEALGGTLDAGPHRGGGYRVHATLPSSDDQVKTKRQRSRSIGTLSQDHL
jgi:signal transduction histidine kinase